MIITDNPEFVLSVARIYRPGQRSESVALPCFTGSTVLAPGPVTPTTRAVLPLMLDMCRRIVPWATVTVAPRLLEAIGRTPQEIGVTFEIDGTTYRGWSGLADQDGNALWVALSTNAAFAMSTAAHECWHCLETRLSLEWIERIDADLAGSFFAEGLEYWDTPKERRARAFETFATRMLEGMPPRLATTQHAHGAGIDEIFAMAWTGEIAREIARLDEIEAMEVGEAA